MLYYRALSILLVILGVSFVMYTNLFVPKTTLALERINTRINNLSNNVTKLKTVIYQNKKSLNNNRNFPVEKVTRTEMLESIRIERNMYEKIQETERYTRNLLISIVGVVIAFIGLFGLFGIQYFITTIAHKAEKDLITRISIKTELAQATLFNHIGFSQYQEYDNNKKKSTENDDNSKLSLDSAIVSTQYTYDAFKLPEKECEEIKCQIMNNLAYYLAVRNDSKDSSKAILLAGKVHAVAKSKKLPNWYDWEETYAFVLYTFGLKHQKNYAFTLIAQLTTDPCIENKEWIKSTSDEWEEFKKAT